VLCGTWGTWSRCRNMQRTVVLKQRHLLGQRCSLARVAANSAHITHSRHMLVGSRRGSRSRRSHHSRSSLKSARERDALQAQSGETARGASAAALVHRDSGRQSLVGRTTTRAKRKLGLHFSKTCQTGCRAFKNVILKMVHSNFPSFNLAVKLLSVNKSSAFELFDTIKY